jgi:hypothetical protein
MVRSTPLAERLAAEAKARMLEELQQNRNPVDLTDARLTDASDHTPLAPRGASGSRRPKTSDELGRIAGVSGTAVERVQRVHREAPDLAPKLATSPFPASSGRRSSPTCGRSACRRGP